MTFSFILFLYMYSISNLVFCKSFAVVKRCLLNKSITHLLTYVGYETDGFEGVHGTLALWRVR